MNELSAVELAINPTKWYSAKENLEKIIRQADEERQSVYDKASKRDLKTLSGDAPAILEDAKSRVILSLNAFLNQVNKTGGVSIFDMSEESLWMQANAVLKYHRKALKDYPEFKRDLDRFVEKQIKIKSASLEKEQRTEKEAASGPTADEKELPEIGITKFPDKYLFQKDAVSKLLFDTGATALALTKDKDLELNTYINIDYDELNGLIEIDGERSFTVYDSSVLNAVISLYFDGGNEFMTIPMIYQVMTGNKNAKITETHSKAISDAIAKCMFSKLNIKSYKSPENYDFEEMSYEGNLLYAEKIRAKHKGNMLEWVRVVKPPILYQYARSLNQVGRLPYEYLRTSVNKSVENLSLQNYLLNQIIYMKDGSRDNVILYEDVYERILSKEELPGTERQKRLRSKGIMIRIMQDWKTQQFITGFNEIIEGKLRVGIMVDVKESK